MTILNNIPKHWKIKKLDEVCEIIMGQSPPSETYNINHVGLPFFQGKAEFKELHPVANKWCSIPKQVALVNDVLLSVRAPVGKVNIADQKCCIGRGLAAIRYENYKYLFYFLKSIEQQLDKKGTGTTFRAISGETIRTTEIPLPPLPEQQAIVSKIEELFSDLENGKQQLLLAQQQLKIYRQSLLKWAFEGKLTNPPNGKVGKNLKDGELPKGWKWIKLGEVCKKIGDIDHKMPEQILEGYPYVSTKDFTDNLKISFDNVKCISKEDYLFLARKIKPERGDIIFPRYGTIGKNILVDFDKEFLVSYSCAVLKPNHKVVLSKYLYLYSLSPKIMKEIKKYTVETTQANVGISSIKNFVFPLTSLKEQQLIVDELESKLTVCDKMEETISQSLMQAEALKQSILKRAFEGKLVAVPVYKPKSKYFYQMQLLGLIAKTSKQKQIHHGEMTLAKYAYLMDKVYDIPTHFEYKRWHLGPYPPTIKKIINNKQYFKKTANYIEVLNEKTLFHSTNPYTEKMESAVYDLSDIFIKYPAKERSYKTELLATVCKVIEDIQTTDLKAVRLSMREWKIILKGEKYKTKADKFSETETEKCIAFIKEKGWDKKLIK